MTCKLLWRTNPGSKGARELLYRKDFIAWRTPLEPEQFVILRTLESGQPLGAALEAAACLPGVGLESLVQKLHGWFREWAAEGFFRALDAEP